MKKYIFILLGALMFLTANQSYSKDTLKLKIDNVGSLTAPYPDLTSSNKEGKNQSNNNSTVTGSVIYNDLKDVAVHYGGKADTLATKAINLIADTTTEIWEVLVRQQRVKAFYYFTLLLLEIYLFFRWFKYLRWYLDKKPEERNGDNVYALVGTLIALLIFAVYNSIHSIDMYTGFFNPKYAAMKELYNIGQILK